MKTKETTIAGLGLTLIKQCDECGRVFDLLKPTDAEEWECGHDCESLSDLILKIRRLTQENHHSEAVCTLAVFAGTEIEIAESKQIAKLHAEIGHMPWALSARRAYLRDSMLASVAEKYGRVNAQAIGDSF